MGNRWEMIYCPVCNRMRAHTHNQSHRPGNPYPSKIKNSQGLENFLQNKNLKSVKKKV
jgi:hypothetical protein